VWCRSALFDPKYSGEVAEGVVRVFEVERQAEDNVQGGLGIAVTAGVKVPRSAPDTAAGIRSSRRNTFGNESTLHPWPHDLGVDLGSIVHNKVGRADHVLKVVV